MIDIFILYELVKISELSAPFHVGSKPKGYTPPVETALTRPVEFAGHSQPGDQIVSDLEKMSLYMDPVKIEKAPMRTTMYRPLLSQLFFALFQHS